MGTPEIICLLVLKWIRFRAFRLSIETRLRSGQGLMPRTVIAPKQLFIFTIYECLFCLSHRSFCVMGNSLDRLITDRSIDRLIDLD